MNIGPIASSTQKTQSFFACHKAQQRPQHESFLAYAKPTTAGSGTGANDKSAACLEGIHTWGYWEKGIRTAVNFYVVVGTFF